MKRFFLIFMLLSACNNNTNVQYQTIDIETQFIEGSGQPNLAKTNENDLIISWIQPDGDSESLYFSIFEENVWGEPTKVAQNVMPNWADIPNVRQINEGFWASSWPIYQIGSYGYDIAISISNNGGVTWNPPFKLNTDITPTEHGFVSLFTDKNDLGVIWIDGRDYFYNGEFDFVSSEGKKLGSQIRFAKFNSKGDRLLEEMIDSFVCDCCQTDIARSKDVNYLVYRNRNNSEIRDIAIRSYLNNAWSDVTTLNNDNWQIDACPINGPSIASKDNILAVSWYDGSDNSGKILSKVSYDYGQSFEELVLVDATDVYGHTDVVITDNNKIFVTWLSNDNNALALKVKEINTNNSSSPFIIYKEIGLGPSDFPKIEYYDNKLFIAWTSYDKTMQVKTKIIHIE